MWLWLGLWLVQREQATVISILANWHSAIILRCPRLRDSDLLYSYDAIQYCMSGACVTRCVLRKADERESGAAHTDRPQRTAQYNNVRDSKLQYMYTQNANPERDRVRL